MQLTKPHLSLKLYIDKSNMIKTYDKQMHVANCENLLLSISCEMIEDQSLYVVDLNERRSDSKNQGPVVNIGANSIRVNRSCMHKTASPPVHAQLLP